VKLILLGNSQSLCQVFIHAVLVFK